MAQKPRENTGLFFIRNPDADHDKNQALRVRVFIGSPCGRFNFERRIRIPADHPLTLARQLRACGLSVWAKGIVQIVDAFGALA
ncbi:MAG: hypothetical protein V2I51_00660 [Anderseniella sp.]|nr:hypothetical protein [Anderseniella sp.]